MTDVELHHHYGWQRYSTAAATLDEAAYAAVRQSHRFLTDSNHTHDAGSRGNYSSVRIYRGEGAPAYSGPDWLKTDYWFTVTYRAPRAITGDSGNG